MIPTHTRTAKTMKGSRTQSTRSSAALAHPKPVKPMTPRRSDRDLASSFGIAEGSLARRREFIRLGEEDRRLMAGLQEWASRVAPEVSREFYDWQFSFAPTMAFFERIAGARGIALASLRSILEASQAGYILGLFTGADQNWGLAYFEDRLVIGSVHDQINLPFKWYVGSYIEMQRLIRAHLRSDFRDVRFVDQADEAISKVLNYDLQAIGDSFLLNTLDSMGLKVAAITAETGADKTEGLQQVKDAIAVLIEQCMALAEGRLNDNVFEKSAPCSGRFGEAFSRIRENFRESMVRISQSAAALSASAEELTAVSQQMSGNAEETAVQSKVVANASDDVSKRVSVVAASAEEMQTSIREISKAANESATVARNAVSAAESANATVHRLGDSSVDIGKVIKVITSIAQQTNLLALNATIEAARAGEAGKGFAVVANEVKELAKETARATEDIGQKIEAIQHDTRSAVEAIAQIGNIIREVNDISNNIAAAVEEQTVTTNEISRNVTEAANGTTDIANNIAGVATAAQDTTRGAADTQTAARALSEMASELQTLVGRFRL
ncbi:MAG TPA: globin-coupled sensor protein [Verrucomicrobiae bacterium]|nr:globin-coupled sensor protein [Verrucomicrobiae bacterium]